MQNNLSKILATVLLLGLAAFYLVPTFKYYSLHSDRQELSGQELSDWETENGEAYRELREEALALGLDLQGGMSVILEVGVDDLIGELARDRDAAFDNALTQARAATDDNSDDVVDAFVDAFLAANPEGRLSRYFRNDAAGVDRRSSNEDVRAYLQAEASEALDRAVSIVRDRVDRFGVSEPSINKAGNRRIVVELAGVTETERVRKLLKGTAKLEFRTMADPNDLFGAVQTAFAYYQERATADTSAMGSPESRNELAQVMSAPSQPSGIFGFVAPQDTARVGELLRVAAIQDALPRDIELLWTSSPEGEAGSEVYYLLGVKTYADLEGDVITEARTGFDPLTNRPEVSMSMNTEGARRWAQLTQANVGKPVAIVLDDIVYSWPTVQGKITGGRSSITGVSETEAADIVTILKSGALPAPVNIDGERTVGPSLGAASVEASRNSLMIGLVLVIIFMAFYYRTAGLVANVALVVNIFLIFGILAAFKATLTLPGMAGIVLTIGMAVDANVLIFERIREELTAGRTPKAALNAGFEKAFSAILDANVTTFLVAMILFWKGIGPIQGFAITLMIGIVSSLFTAYVVARIIFNMMIEEKGKAVNFG